LLVFQPFIAHSVREHSGLPFFHPQMLADFATIEELGYKVLQELRPKEPSVDNSAGGGNQDGQ